MVSSGARAGFPGATLADLYDPLPRPPALAAADAALDRAVDKYYRKEAFPSDRVEYLFQLYENLTTPLAPNAKPKRTRKVMSSGFSLTPSLSRWERAPRIPRLDQSGRADNTPRRKAYSLSQRERVG